MKVRDLMQKLEVLPPESEMMIKNLDGTLRPMTLVGFHHEDGTESVLASDPVIVIPGPEGGGRP